ncbi:MAG: glycoside hydrolase family 2 protein, partial [Bacteroidota bacterium]|nr:glycoside hydrolase family 2 protein [Bacteroidota bacterium]
MKKNICILLLFLVHVSQAQIRWPVVTQTNKPWTRWWWEGSAVDEKNLTATMEQYHAAGLGGLEITPIYGVKGYEKQFVPFLSTDWMRLLHFTLQEGKRIGLGIDLANATGWPFGGPWVKPEDAAKNVNTLSYQLQEGEMLKTPIRFHQLPMYRSESHAIVNLDTLLYPIARNNHLQQYAFDQVRFDTLLAPSCVMGYDSRGHWKDLTSLVDEKGMLQWKAEKGDWKILALFTGFHGKLVERAAPGGEGDVIDHFSKRALQHYLHRFDSAFYNQDLSGLRAFFNDSYEVDDAKGQSNWTPEFLTQFQKRRGYDLRPYLMNLFDNDSSAIHTRVLMDYRTTVADFMLDHFTRPWQDWAAKQQKKVRNQSHGSPGNILDLYAAVDIPETEGTDIMRYKFATSAANVMGKPLASSETATWLNEHFLTTLGDVKKAVDQYFIGGVNHVFWHGTVYSPQEAPWPGWLFYAAVHFTPANPFWRDFGTLNSYVARCQSFLQRGKPDNDVLLYFPFNDRIAVSGKTLLQHFDGMNGFENTLFQSDAVWMQEKGYGFDFISDKQVKGLISKGKSLQAPGGIYQTILLSDVSYISLGTLTHLQELAEKGACILFHKRLPDKVPGLLNWEKDEKKIRDFFKSLRFVKKNNASLSVAKFGKGCFLFGDQLEELLDASHVRRETLVDQGLQMIRRKNAGGVDYFITNPGGSDFSGWVPLQVPASRMVLYDPMIHVAGMAMTKTEKGVSFVYLQIAKGGSCLLSTGNTKLAGEGFPYTAMTKDSTWLTGKWQLEFLKGGPVLPQKKEITQLASWTDLLAKDEKYFSGTARYRLQFVRPAGKADFYQLDLGKVSQSAEVYL